MCPIEPWILEELSKDHDRRFGRDFRVPDRLPLPVPDYSAVEVCQLDGTPVSLAEGVCRICGNAVGTK